MTSTELPSPRVCLAYALYRISETIFLLYSDVEKLVAEGTKISLKSPGGVEVFSQTELKTHHSTQLQKLHAGNLAGCHCVFAGNFKILCSLVNELDRDNIPCVVILQEIFNDSNKLKLPKNYFDLHSCTFQFSILQYNKMADLL
jgi:hypothetical protein